MSTAAASGDKSFLALIADLCHKAEMGRPRPISRVSLPPPFRDTDTLVLEPAFGGIGHMSASFLCLPYPHFSEVEVEHGAPAPESAPSRFKR